MPSCERERERRQEGARTAGVVETRSSQYRWYFPFSSSVTSPSAQFSSSPAGHGGAHACYLVRCADEDKDEGEGEGEGERREARGGGEG